MPMTQRVSSPKSNAKTGLEDYDLLMLGGGSALRDAVLTNPTLVEDLISLFSSVPSAQDVVNTTSTTAA